VKKKLKFLHFIERAQPASLTNPAEFVLPWVPGDYKPYRCNCRTPCGGESERHCVSLLCESRSLVIGAPDRIDADPATSKAQHVGFMKKYSLLIALALGLFVFAPQKATAGGYFGITVGPGPAYCDPYPYPVYYGGYYRRYYYYDYPYGYGDWGHHRHSRHWHHWHEDDDD
jgi:hypothetical protein